MQRMIGGVLHADASEIAEIFCVSRAVLYKRMTQGMPTVTIKQFHWFPIDRCKEWYANTNEDVLWRDDELFIGRKRMRKFLKVTAERMRELEESGMPHETIEGERKYPMRRCREWFYANHGDTIRPTGSLCLECDKALYAGCAWIRFGKPVEGWDAIATKIPAQIWGRGEKAKKKERYMLDSYCVRKCPEFEPDRDARRNQ